MYKVKSLLAASCLLFFLASCTDDPERHELTPAVNSLVVYADQTTGSIDFYTFDSWTVKPQADWITVDGDAHADFVYDYTKRYLCTVFFNLQPNTSGKTREGSVLVQSYDYSTLIPFLQLGMLNVSHPAATVDSTLPDYSKVPAEAHYELTLDAQQTSDSLCFTVQNNWELTFVGEKPEWIELDKDTDLPGSYSVHLTLQPNTDTEAERETTLKLTSGDVSNEIKVRQIGKLGD